MTILAEPRGFGCFIAPPCRGRACPCPPVPSGTGNSFKGPVRLQHQPIMVTGARRRRRAGTSPAPTRSRTLPIAVPGSLVTILPRRPTCVFPLPLKASAIPAHKYPECQSHAARAANRLEPNPAKLPRTSRQPAENSLCWQSDRSFGRQSAPETEPDHLAIGRESRCTSHPVTTAAMLHWLLSQFRPLLSSKIEEQQFVKRTNTEGQRCSARPATSGVSTTPRNRAAWKPGACSDRRGGSFSHQNLQTPASSHPATSRGQVRCAPPASVAEGFHPQPKSDRSSSLCQALEP